MWVWVRPALHAKQRLHQWPLVVGGTAAPHRAVLERGAERRHRPLRGVHRLEVPVNDEPEHRKAVGLGKVDLGHRVAVAHHQTQLGPDAG